MTKMNNELHFIKCHMSGMNRFTDIDENRFWLIFSDLLIFFSNVFIALRYLQNSRTFCAVIDSCGFRNYHGQQDKRDLI